MKGKKYLFILVLFLATKTFGQTDMSSAHSMFIYNFLKQVQWPGNVSGDSYVIGVLGGSQAYNSLIKFTANKRIGNKAIKVVKYNNATDVQNCHVLFITYSQSKAIAEVTSKVNSCLIIGEKSGLSDKGAVIDFHLDGNKLKFKLNEANAKKQNLMVSSTLKQMSI